jgi:hypothetical protein
LLVRTILFTDVDHRPQATRTGVDRLSTGRTATSERNGNEEEGNEAWTATSENSP